MANTFKEWEQEFLDWLEVRKGLNTPNLTLRYCNRAQQWIERYDLWDDLIKTETLTLTNGSLEVALPSDLDRVLYIGSDTDNDGDVDIYYFKDENGPTGYQYRSTFDKNTGVRTKTITFHEAPPSPLKVKYVTAIEELTGEGTEYLFFPKQLVLRRAQTMRIEEKGVRGNSEYVILKQDFERELKMYQENHQYVNQTYDMQPKDAFGNDIIIPTTDALGGRRWPYNAPYSRARDIG